jgi:hypothetical protein
LLYDFLNALQKDRIMTTNQVQTGGCLCAQLRYEVSGPSVWTAICYCDSCTRAAGALAVAWAGIETSRFRVLRGAIQIYQSTPGVLRGFCRRCGTTLTYQKNPEVIPGAQDQVYVSTRTLDDPNAYPPDEHVFYGERVAWFHADDERPHHETLSPDYAHLQLLTLKQGE